MKTKTINLYEYHELSPEAKEKARTDWNNGNDMPFLANEIKEKLAELLDENKIDYNPETLKVYYSLAYCQGDGAMFEGDLEWKGHNLSIKQSGRYYHSYSKDITWHDFVGEDKEAEEEEIAKDFEALYQKICKELEKFGYSMIEYEESEEYFKELCEANEYTFEANGRMNNI